MEKLNYSVPEIELIEKPDRKKFPYCDFRPELRTHRKTAQAAEMVTRSRQSSVFSPDLFSSLLDYKQILTRAGVDPDDIDKCVVKRRDLVAVSVQPDTQLVPVMQSEEVFSKR